jgi:hypothetical protein
LHNLLGTNMRDACLTDKTLNGPLTKKHECNMFPLRSREMEASYRVCASTTFSFAPFTFLLVPTERPQTRKTAVGTRHIWWQ